MTTPSIAREDSSPQTDAPARVTPAPRPRKRRGDGLYQRGKTWWLDFIHEGRRHHARLGKGITRSVAAEIATVKRGQILRGEAGIGPKLKHDLTFDKAKEHFLAWAKANRRPKTHKSYAQCLASLATSFSGKRLSEIHPFLIEKYKRARIEAEAPVSANRELGALKAVYNRCREWGLYEGDNPAARVKGTKERKGRLRYLEIDEEGALLNASAEPLRSIVLVGLHAGLRIQSEALTLQKPDVDLRRGLVTVQAAYAKNGSSRSVPLNAILREALGRLLQTAPGPYVFTTRDGQALKSIRTAFATARRRAGLGPDVTPHVLRHTFASKLAMAGVDLRTIQELGGWKDLTMVQRYSHLSPSHKAAAVEKIAGGAVIPLRNPEQADQAANTGR